MRLRPFFMLALALLAACSHATQGTVAPASTVRFDLAADPSSLNPLFSHPDAALVEQQLARLAFEPFIDLDAKGHLEPALLREIPTVANGGLSSDGRTITYHLRSNARWNDGRPVTSEDVLFTLHAILDPRNPVESHEGYDLIDRATAPNAQTVVVHLKQAWAPAVSAYFSYGTSPQYVLPAHVLRAQTPLAQAAFNAAPLVGDGPYRFVSWTRGVGLRYDANPLYWRGKPAVAHLDIHIAADPSTNLLMLQSGVLDWNVVAPAQYQVVEHNRHLRFASVPTAVIAGIVFNTTHAPLDDVRVRRAVAMSIDRANISAKITLGKYPVSNALQPQFSWAYDPKIALPRFDTAAADALLDRAGWLRGKDGMRYRGNQPLHFTYVQFPETTTGVRVATTVQSALRQRGIDVTIKSISNAQLFLPKLGTLAKGQFDLAYVPFTMSVDPDDSFVLGCNGASNYMRWCNRRVDALERQAIASTSQAQRASLYGQIGRIVAQEVPIVYLFNADYIYAYRDRMTGFAPNAFLPTWNAGSWRL